MTYQELVEYNAHRDLNQFSVIVPNLDEAVKKLDRILENRSLAHH